MPSKSVAFRALLALILMVGFYVFALAIAGILIYIPYAEVAYAHRLHGKIALFCVGGALIILWSLVPRVEKFIPPGPRLNPSEHPELFRELNDIAGKVGQAMPSEVFLVSDVNAWVGQRGGIMGMGSRRIMGLGLPLLQILNISELRAVLAHEFGHYYGGDTKLGPWIYKTRAAIGRTLKGLAGHSSFLQKPFMAYGKMFLRITHAVSRAQEYSADGLAARTVGAKHLISGLEKVHGAGMAFQSYWGNEVVPVLNSGFIPGMAEGFSTYLKASPVEGAVSAFIKKEKEDSGKNPYDTHPPLGQRISALSQYPGFEESRDENASLTLLNHISQLETELLVSLGGEERVKGLKPISWARVGEMVYLPLWEALVTKHEEDMRGITPDMLPVTLDALKVFAQKLVETAGGEFQFEQGFHYAQSVVGAALAIIFYDRGWRLQVDPGEDVLLNKGSQCIRPFSVLGRLHSGELSARDWEVQCSEAGINGMKLGDVRLGKRENVQC